MTFEHSNNQETKIHRRLSQVALRNKFESQFLILNFLKTFRLDRTAKGGGILL